MPTRILLADDHRLVRNGFRLLIEKNADMQVVGEASDGRSAVQMAGRLAPDIIVMDIGMPDLNGIEATRQIVAENPRARVVGLSMHGDRHYVVEMLRVGASGYLLKDSAPEELVEALRIVMKGKTYLSPSIAHTVVEACRRPTDPAQPSAFQLLTDREREVVQLLTEGLSAKEIGDKLSMSIKTVSTHRQNIMDKLGVNSIAELTKYAIREGLTSL